MLQLNVKKLHPYATIPAYATEGSAGFDFCALQSMTVDPGTSAIIPTGLAFEVPFGYYLSIISRSGLATTGVTVFNSPGIIDSDYRGEVGILLKNHTELPLRITSGSRCAQGILCKIPEVEIVEVEELSDTLRGSGGFGSTGR